MKRRRYIGIDLHDGNMRIAGMHRRWRKGAQLFASRIENMPKDMTLESLKQASPEAEQVFVNSLHKLLLPIASKERRLALSLPDRCGYVMTMDVAGFTRSRKESREVVAWQLRKLLPGIADLHFDYQVLKRTGGGKAHLLVVAMEKQALDRYETLFQKAGFILHTVGFFGLNIYRHWRYRLDPEGDAILLAMNEDGIIVQTYRDSVLSYYRAGAVGSRISHQLQELHRIVAGCAQDFSPRNRARVFLHADRPVDETTLDALNDCFGRKVLLLTGHGHISPALAAAQGAAERMMMGG
ncbi:type II secretion system ATPase PulM, putative [Syntrophotalea carbinolica DSM 2380]|uniref:Type II secretion system ATPase PulM, putative n=1 Tax=Syntrophotalea carbinolica (strain DSM 2380 / NBRC 103641 / GraBd1) TaxID=338963 RepID=Q3A3Y1_SYNC1|nr:hypothetical protein [Syntrophotalea carbinolica]ABA88926.1 type II secretion system ATPase PulM, putative [Syntrophotalea carbinolica DSM 2380]